MCWQLKGLKGFQCRPTPGDPLQCLVKLDPLDVNFEKLTMYFEHLTGKQYTETDSLISEDFALEILL